MLNYPFTDQLYLLYQQQKVFQRKTDILTYVLTNIQRTAIIHNEQLSTYTISWHLEAE